MKRMWALLQRVSVASLATIVFLFFPATTSAGALPTEEVQPAKTGPSSSSPPKDTSYKYNQDTGLWENDEYIWDPSTHHAQPKQEPKQIYNPATKTWDTKDWHFDADKQAYTPQIPKAAYHTSAAGTSSEPQALRSQNITTTDSSDLSSKTGIAHDHQVHSKSGNAEGSNNATTGNAISGQARATANTINILQSSWGIPGQNVANFSSDIIGNPVGDIIFDPAANIETGAATSGGENAVHVSTSQDTSMHNAVTVTAQSGTASLTHNTRAQNAQSGDASAIANVVNLMGSLISAGKSFIGNINIYGDYEGDILLPDSLNDRFAGHSASTQPLQSSDESNTNSQQITTNDQHITNNVRMHAQSGNAHLEGNTVAGNAKTGTSTTNLVVYDLTRTHISGQNALLVFVNVLGEWVGMLVDAPQGSTTKMLTDGNASTAVARGTDKVHSSTRGVIQNDIEVRAESGNASITHNTQAGDATTGSAKVGVNVLNLQSSQLALSDWFGILFINVLGSWRGSFGVNTEMGNRPLPSRPAPTYGAPITDQHTVVIVANAGNIRDQLQKNITSIASIDSDNTPLGAVKASSTLNSALTLEGPQNHSGTSQKSSASSPLPYIPVGVATLASLSLLFAERILVRKVKSNV